MLEDIRKGKFNPDTGEVEARNEEGGVLIDDKQTEVDTEEEEEEEEEKYSELQEMLAATEVKALEKWKAEPRSKVVNVVASKLHVLGDSTHRLYCGRVLSINYEPIGEHTKGSWCKVCRRSGDVSSEEETMGSEAGITPVQPSTNMSALEEHLASL